MSDTAICHIGDVHYGKRTSSYGIKECVKRFEVLGKAILATKRQFPHLKKLVLAIAGDVNDGTGIFPGQEHCQDASNVEMQAWQCASIIARWLAWQGQYWQSVEVQAVPGNHGMSGKFAHEGANWDIVCYRYLSTLSGKSIPVFFESNLGDVFMRKFQVDNHNILLYHGHTIRMYQTIPYYGISQRVMRWSTSSIAPFDLVLLGHFHHTAHFPVNKIEVLTTGTMVSDDPWALRTLGLESSPSAWLFTMNESGLEWIQKISYTV